MSSAEAGARTPDFFIVGHQKSGTTALHEMLRRHPQVYMPDLKEPRWFAPDMYVRPGSSVPGGLPATLADYLALFAPAGPELMAGEASPLYLASATAASEIHALRSDARIIAILREPASFLRSLHLQYVETHLESRNDLLGAIALDDERRHGRLGPRMGEFTPQALVYSDQVRYVEQLARYERFGPDRVLVLIYDDFRSDNEATVRQVLSFLGVDDGRPVQATEANPTVHVRSQPVHQLLHSVALGSGPGTRAMKGAVKAIAPRRVRRGAWRAAHRRVVAREAPEPEERALLELRARFKGEVVALSEHLARDLVSLWGYDAV
jgi:hypothetical protein